MKTNDEIVFGYDPASPEGDKARVCVRHPDGTIEVFVRYAEIAEAVKVERYRVIQEIDDSRDHDSCECDNCHRWRRYYKKANIRITI